MPRLDHSIELLGPRLDHCHGLGAPFLWDPVASYFLPLRCPAEGTDSGKVGS